ncbi:MAG TPA: SAM-dependent methyltransferase [Sedimenticola sp.]|nr:SAM-dependent methyltransferase [Sedimenticola sp.]
MPELPEPSADELAHSARLQTLIAEQLSAAGGLLPFDRYMELALYAPGLGYYTAGARKFGAEGDFVTAPEISPLFGRCLARQVLQVLAHLGGGDLLEFGAGSGALALQLLSELETLGRLPSRYLILELSPELRQRQRVLLEERLPALVGRVQWLDRLPEAGFRGVVIANELLDAMPVHRFRVEDGRVREQFLCREGDGLGLCWAAPADSALEAAVSRLPPLPDGYESELNLRAAPWLHALAERLQTGLVLLIDYGYPRALYYHPARHRGTLMCHYRHRAHPDPLRHPGLQDITAHVDFTALAEAAVAAGLQVAGFTTQAFFLMGSGLQQLVAAADPSDVATHMRLVQGVRRLTLPGEMGERFKVLGLSRDLPLPLLGFSVRDMRERL